jgi:CoA:oxalate CoA-transferase
MLLVDALGAPELIRDPRFMTNELRCRNRAAMIAAIEALTAQEPVEHWIEKLNAAGVPCSPINTIDKLIDHPQLKARNMIIQVKGDGPQTIRTAGNPIKLTGYAEIDPDQPARAPGLDQHREAIIAQLMADYPA